VRSGIHSSIVQILRCILLCDRPARPCALRNLVFFPATCACLARLHARLAVTRNAVACFESDLASQVWPALSIHAIPNFLLVNVKHDFNYDFIRDTLECVKSLILDIP
jgi:hypothetical protein